MVVGHEHDQGRPKDRPQAINTTKQHDVGLGQIVTKRNQDRDLRLRLEADLSSESVASCLVGPDSSKAASSGGNPGRETGTSRVRGSLRSKRNFVRLGGLT